MLLHPPWIGVFMWRATPFLMGASASRPDLTIHFALVVAGLHVLPLVRHPFASGEPDGNFGESTLVKVDSQGYERQAPLFHLGPDFCDFPSMKKELTTPKRVVAGAVAMAVRRNM